MKISVITAVYNAEHTVAEAIASVACQTWPGIEHIVVEGLSTDASLAEIHRAEHARMRLISDADDGIYDALNKGIRASTGDVIGFVHSDDLLPHDGVLAKIAGAFADPAIAAVFGDLDYVAKTDTRRVVRHWAAGPFRKGGLGRGWMPPHPTLYLRKAVLDRFGAFDTTYDIAADYDLVLRVFSQDLGATVYLPEVLYTMRLGGVSNRGPRQILRKMAEDYRAIRHNGIGGLPTLILKNLRKTAQFVRRG